eukprot:2695027-Karenia_brevis.AAC.1
MPVTAANESASRCICTGACRYPLHGTSPYPELRCHSIRAFFDDMPIALKPERKAVQASLTAACPGTASACKP